MNPMDWGVIHAMEPDEDPTGFPAIVGFMTTYTIDQIMVADEGFEEIYDEQEGIF